MVVPDIPARSHLRRNSTLSNPSGGTADFARAAMYKLSESFSTSLSCGSFSTAASFRFHPQIECGKEGERENPE